MRKVYKLKLSRDQKLVLYEIVGIEQQKQMDGSMRLLPKEYPVGQDVDASSILKKLITTGIPFLGDVTFEEGEVDFERSEFDLLKAQFKSKAKWSVAQVDMRKDLEKLLEETKE